MTKLRDLTATQLRVRIAKGEISPLEAATALIEAIAREDRKYRAWTAVASAAVLEEPLGQAQDLVSFPLFGIPIGLKDNIETKDFKTEYGSEIYRSHRPSADAACVSRLRETGAIVLGKTALAEFAVRRPCDTRNPLDDTRTPGGSSSGSAAAVAARMIPLAVGTQTGGSIIRPAAYCGVYAIKPSFGIVNRSAVKPISDTADTIGFFARSLEDLALILGATSRNHSLARLAFEGLATRAESIRLAFCRTPQWGAAAPPMQEFFGSVQETAVARCSAVKVDLPRDFEGLDLAADLVTEFETWQSLGFERLRHEGQCSGELAEVFQRGHSHTFEHYVAARKHIEAARHHLDRFFDGFDCLVTPSAPGEAPIGLSDTGPSTFNKIWTVLHVPCVNVPAGRGSNGLPFGLQVISARYRDEVALAGATQLRAVLGELSGN